MLNRGLIEVRNTLGNLHGLLRATDSYTRTLHLEGLNIRVEVSSEGSRGVAHHFGGRVLVTLVL